MPSLDTQKATQALVLKAKHPDWGYIRIGQEINWHKDKVRRAIEHAQRRTNDLLPTLQRHSDFPGLIEIARNALIAAKHVGEVKDVRDKAEALRIYGKLANDHQLEADAAEVRLKAERKLGMMLAAERAAGTFGDGRNRPKVNGTDGAPLNRVTLEQAGIDRKLSARSQKIAALSESLFDAAVDRVRERISDGGMTSLDIAGQSKKERRNNRERVLGECQLALPTKKYGVIVADPEWRFEPWSRETGMDRAADNHYPTSVTEVIAARDVASIAATDCVLFLWATGPMIREALAVMSAWGFEYKSQYVWGKDRAGTGYWNRERHELLLIGTRGQVPAPAMGTQRDSLILSPRLVHSEKPECFLEMIEQYFPTLPKIELNRRGPVREGWDAWGNEVADNK